MMLFGIWALVGLCKTAYLHFNSHSPGESGLVDFPQFSASLVLVKNLTGWVVQVTMGWMSLLSPSQECHSTGGKVVSWWAVSWLVYDAVQVNAHESIILNSWVSRVQYNALCHVLGTGMSIHLQVYIYIYIGCCYFTDILIVWEVATNKGIKMWCGFVLVCTCGINDKCWHICCVLLC